MSPNETPALDRIEKTPGVCGGNARIRGRRIPVWLLVQGRHLGMTEAEQLASFEPPLALADLEAAWAYYEQNREEIDQAIRENEEA